jgi:hypothetical protein
LLDGSDVIPVKPNRWIVSVAFLQLTACSGGEFNAQRATPDADASGAGFGEFLIPCS